jgi:hypothetical protein
MLIAATRTSTLKKFIIRFLNPHFLAWISTARNSPNAGDGRREQPAIAARAMSVHFKGGELGYRGRVPHVWYAN